MTLPPANINTLTGYTVSASSVYSGFPATNTFDYSTNLWITSASTYNASTGVGISAATIVSGTTYTGEWIQLLSPMSTYASGYLIMTSAEATSSLGLMQWVFAGSMDGTTWTMIDNKTGSDQILAGGNTTYTFSVTQPSTTFCYYRLIITKKVSGTPYDNMNFGEFRIFAKLPAIQLSSVPNGLNLNDNLTLASTTRHRVLVTYVRAIWACSAIGSSTATCASHNGARANTYGACDRFAIEYSAVGSITLSQQTLSANDTHMGL